MPLPLHVVYTVAKTVNDSNTVTLEVALGRLYLV
jgi:hypothetical protein